MRLKERPRPEGLKRDLAARLGRAEGQLRGIRRMVAEEAYCVDVLQQLSAVRRALARLGLLLMRDHLETCVSGALAAKRPGGKVRELIKAIDCFLA